MINDLNSLFTLYHDIQSCFVLLFWFKGECNLVFVLVIVD